MLRSFLTPACIRPVLLGTALLVISPAALADDAAPPTEAAPAAEPAPANAPTPTPEPAPVAAAPVAEAPAPVDATSPETPAPPKPPPYSLPFQLRPAVASSVIRSDTAFAFYKPKGADSSGSTVASMLLASYKVTESFAPLVRLGVASNSPPTGDGAFNFLNPVLGATYAIKPAKPLRLAFFLGVTIPVGSGGGDKPDAKNVATNKAGILARSAMDNAMFAVNDFTVFPGVDLAYVAGGFTAQIEGTLFQLTRVRGDAPAVPDSSRTNFTSGLHLGYFLIPELSLAAELRHQRWLSTPKAIDTVAAAPNRDTTTVAFGVRAHFKLGDKTWLRPGVALAFPLDKPMTDSKYKIVQLDIPFAF